MKKPEIFCSGKQFFSYFSSKEREKKDRRPNKQHPLEQWKEERGPFKHKWQKYKWETEKDGGEIKKEDHNP